MLLGLVVFARDLLAVSHFYQSVFALHKVRYGQDHMVLQNSYMELAVYLQKPLSSDLDEFASDRSRSGVALKPVFILSGPMAAINSQVLANGGCMYLHNVWDCAPYRVCDGEDCEGNVFQVRTLAIAPCSDIK